MYTIEKKTREGNTTVTTKTNTVSDYEGKKMISELKKYYQILWDERKSHGVVTKTHGSIAFATVWNEETVYKYIEISKTE